MDCLRPGARRRVSAYPPSGKGFARALPTYPDESPRDPFAMSLLPLLSMIAFAAPTTLLPLWPAGNPDGWTRSDVEETVRQKAEAFEVVRNVSHPTLQFFRAAGAKPHAPTVLVLPGGGYWIEAIEHEGREIAERLNRSGIHAALLKYRLPNRDADKPLYRAPLQDVQRAVRLVRAHAAEWGIDPARVGAMGFSAGGHLAALASNLKTAIYAAADDADRLDARPAFTVLIYPAYLAVEGKADLQADLEVEAGAPPAFLVQTMDDPIHVENALAYTLACRHAGVSAELHVFPKGGHGYGLRTKEPGLAGWMELLVAWIDRTFPE